MNIRQVALFGVTMAAAAIELTCQSPMTPSDCRPRLPTDTTSHAFIWRIDTLGDGNGSQLNDVFIIDENNVWAVGEMYLRDSTGQLNPIAYNLAKWDGTKWNLSRIYFNCGSGQGSAFAARAIFGFGQNDVWITSAGTVARWDGSTYSFLCIPSEQLPGSINEIWGASPNSVYLVGNIGTVVYYNGSNWTKLNSGTTIDIQDIWGATDCRGETEILAVASYGTEIPQAKELLKIVGTTVSEVSSDGLPLALASVWFSPMQKYYVGGDLLYSTSTLGDRWQQEPNQPLYYVSKIRGTGLNDVVVCGGLGHLSHFNGASWKHYTGSELPRIEGNYISVAIHPRVAVAVGGIVGGKAIALVGRR
jgi:hypothetical protein